MTDNTTDKLEFPETKTTELRIDYEDLLKNDKKLVPQFWVNKYKKEASKNWHVIIIFILKIYIYILNFFS